MAPTRLAEDIPRDWWLYKITNPSGRIYIGLTCNFNKRMSYYKRIDCKHQQALSKSLKKYGYESHTVEVIEQFNANHLFALGKELFWIRTMMSNAGKFPERGGLNLSDGGIGSIGVVMSEKTKEKLRQANLGKRCSEETKRKLSDMFRGRVLRKAWTKEQRESMSNIKMGTRHTEEAKRKIGEASKGNKNAAGIKQTAEHIEARNKVNRGNKYNLGKKLSEAHKAKISEANKGKLQSERTRYNMKMAQINIHGKPVTQCTKDGQIVREFATVSDAAMEMKSSTGNICVAIRNKTKDGGNYTVGGYVFKYKNKP